jgi:hypothetical protein
VLYYNALCHGMDYADPGASYYEDSYYEERYRQRVLAKLRLDRTPFGPDRGHSC